MAENGAPWLLAVDGAARGNPGPAGCGAVIYDSSGAVVHELSKYLGHATNNVAEYQGLLMGLRAALELGQKNLVIQTDSQLIVRQLTGAYRVKDEKLKVLFEQARGLLRRLDSYRIVHVGREMNKFADRLANRGIDRAIRRRTDAG
jgi:ribonuclease HI